MIDIHTHILPGVDDGVETMEEAVEFAGMAAGDGVTTIVATPHCKEGFWPNDRASVLRDVSALRERLATEGVDIEILPGSEVHVCPELVERIADGRAVTLGDNGKTLLLELSLSQYPVELENLVFQLKLAGIHTIFAHPERVRYFQDDFRRYEAVIRLGAFGQITTGSLLGRFGSTARTFSEEALEKGLAHIIASDSHDLRSRPPVLRRAVEAAAEFVGESLAERMVNEIPRALVEGREPDIPPMERPAPRRKASILGRLFGRG
jgi:protein-tyrosine phosphatase